MYSRQGCAEKINVLEDGSIPQVRITSYGLNGKPLEGKGEYYGYIACHMMPKNECIYSGQEKEFRIMQDGRDGDEEPGYIGFMSDGCTAGFVSFDCKNVKKIAIKVRGYMYGAYEFRNKLDGPVIGKIDNLHNCNIWERYETDIDLPDGINDLYITYVGGGCIDLLSFELI